MTNHTLIPVSCKKCRADDVIKCGHIRGKQRFRCKKCGYTFIIGDERTTEQIALKKALLLMLYTMTGTTFRELGRLFNLHPSQVFRWVVRSGFAYPAQDIYGQIDHINVDAAEDFVQQKICHFDKSKPVIVGSGELMPGYRAIVLIQPPDSNNVKAKDYPTIQYRTLSYANR